MFPLLGRTPDTSLFEPMLTCENSFKTAYVDLLRRYSNRADLLEQLRRVIVILSDDSRKVELGEIKHDEREPLVASA